MAQGKITFNISLDATELKKRVRKIEGDVFTAYFQEDEELQTIKNLNIIVDSSDRED